MATEQNTLSPSIPSCPDGKIWLRLLFDDENKITIKKPFDIDKQTPDAPSRIEDNVWEKIAGSIFGLAVGDALGAHVEFRPHEYLLEHPVSDLGEGGTWGLTKGQFTDDTSMALCLALSLIAHQGLNLYDQLVRYKWWFRHGYMSSTGHCFDIGAATRKSVEEFEKRQTNFAKKHNIPEDQIDNLSDPTLLREFNVNCSEEGVAGNGSLMRLAPVPLFFYRHPPTAVDFAGRSGEVTHGDPKAIDACRYYAALIVAALHGESREELLDDDFYTKHDEWFGKKELHVDILNISRGSYKKQGGYDDSIRGGGYVVKALEAALWAFWSTKSFEEGALAAVNLGDDTDTTAAIFGQLAGAFYGLKQLPTRWVDEIYAKKFIFKICGWLGYEGEQWLSKSQPLKVSAKPVTSASASEKRGRSALDTTRATPTGKDYTEYLKWTCNDLGLWLESLDADLVQYVESFKRKKIDGSYLLQVANGRNLEHIGLQNETHRKMILAGIEQLKEQVPTDFYHQFQNDDYACFSSQMKTQQYAQQKYQHLHMLVDGWIGKRPRAIPTYAWGLVPDSAQYRIFLQQILSIKYQNGSGGFRMILDAQLYLQDQIAILERLRKYKRETQHQRFNKVCIVRGWFGCTHDEMSQICHDGFQREVKLGPGQTDKGFCFKSSFKAAAKDVDVIHGCVIMCYIILRHPFPTLIASNPSTATHNRYRFYSDGIHSIYQDECPILNNPHQTIHNRNSSDIQAGLYDEFVTFQKKDILPQVVVYLR